MYILRTKVNFLCSWILLGFCFCLFSSFTQRWRVQSNGLTTLHRECSTLRLPVFNVPGCCWTSAIVWFVPWLFFTQGNNSWVPVEVVERHDMFLTWPSYIEVLLHSLIAGFERFGAQCVRFLLESLYHGTWEYRIYSNRGRVLIEAWIIYKPGFMFSFQK